jgi:hypothetical protein
MESTAAVETLEAISASAAALAAKLRGTADPGPAGADQLPDHADPLPDQPDPLQEQAATWLDALTEAARLEARVAALKVHAAAGFASAEAALAAPEASPKERSVLQMSVTAEVAGALTVSEGSAARLLEESARLSRDLPLTLAGAAGRNSVLAACPGDV